MAVGVAVGTGVYVGVAVAVGSTVAVGECVGVGVAVLVGTAVGVSSARDIGAGVAVGGGVSSPHETSKMPATPANRNAPNVLGLEGERFMCCLLAKMVCDSLRRP